MKSAEFNKKVWRKQAQWSLFSGGPREWGLGRSVWEAESGDLKDSKCDWVSPQLAMLMDQIPKSGHLALLSMILGYSWPYYLSLSLSHKKKSRNAYRGHTLTSHNRSFPLLYSSSQHLPPLTKYILFIYFVYFLPPTNRT